MKFVIFTIIAINLLIFSSLARGANCKSLSASKCKKNDSCVYVKAGKRGKTKVSAYCRSKPSKNGAISKAKKKSKKTKKVAKKTKTKTKKKAKSSKKKSKKKMSKTKKKAKKLKS